MKRHDLDVFSLVFGLLFVGAAAVWTFADADALRFDSGALPGLLIGVGVFGLLASVGSRVIGRRTAEPAAGPLFTSPERPEDPPAERTDGS